MTEKAVLRKVSRRCVTGYTKEARDRFVYGGKVYVPTEWIGRRVIVCLVSQRRYNKEIKLENTNK